MEKIKSAINKIKEFLKKHRRLFDFLIILFVSLIMCSQLFTTNVNVYTDDGIQHIGRAYATYETIKNNGLFTRVLQGLSNGFGYSWDLFYGPLSVWLILVAKFVFTTFISSYKMVVFLTVFLSGYFMYLYLKEMMKNNNVGVLAAILYITFPYHLTDIYTRNALGEIVSFVFLPLVFLGIHRIIFDGKDKRNLLAIGAIGLLLTHNISTMLTAFFAGIYLLTNLEKINKDRISQIGKSILLIVLVTSFFWLPLLQTAATAKYAVYNGMMSNPDDTYNRALSLKQLIVSLGEDGFIFELGPHILIIFCLSIMTFGLLTKPIKEQYLAFVLLAIISLWMSTKYFPWKYLPAELSIVQFPWRLLMFSGFFLSIICSINVYAVIKRFNFKDVCVIGIIAVLYSLALFIPLIAKVDDIKDIDQYTLGNFSGKEVEWVPGCGYGEYLTLNAHENRFNLATRENNIYVLEGSALIENEKQEGLTYTADITTYGDDYTILELPYIYYPGYELRLDGAIENTFCSKNGLVAFVMFSDIKLHLDFKYTGTTLMTISNLISICAVIYLVLDSIFVFEDRLRKKKDSENLVISYEKEEPETVVIVAEEETKE